MLKQLTLLSATPNYQANSYYEKIKTCVTAEKGSGNFNAFSSFR